MFRTSLFAATIAATTFLPGQALAATVTLDLTTLGSFALANGAGNSATLGGSTVTAGGVTTITSGLDVTLLAFTSNGDIKTSNSGGVRTIRSFTTSGPGTSVTAAALNFDAGGAGVTNTTQGGSDSPNADTAGGYSDFFEIVVPTSATLTSVTFTEKSFSGGKSRSNFVWAFDSSADGSIGNGDNISGQIRLAAAGSTSFGATSDAFLIGASGNGSAWRLASVTFDYTPTVTVVPAVPLPAAGALLLTALGALVFGARRRRDPI